MARLLFGPAPNKNITMSNIINIPYDWINYGKLHCISSKIVGVGFSAFACDENDNMLNDLIQKISESEI